MASEGVQPLRISKSSSPLKMSASAIPRPLGEISPMGIRRNSPSFKQAINKKPSLTSTGDSSPFEPSPANSPLHSYWKTKENASPTRISNENTPLQAKSPCKRSSVENLKKASRVTNSTMYAREQESEFDPDASSVLSNRPLSAYSTKVAQAWGDLRSNPSFRGHRRTESNTNIPTLSRTPSPAKPASPLLSKQNSPQKSSLSSNSRYGPQESYNLDDSIFEDAVESRQSTRANTPRALRKPKSVTFDAQPPQINHYEMVTPDPSSIASGSREGSVESETYDMDDSFEHGSFQREDSFDESLEDADKTPVVLPEDWRFMSPGAVTNDLADTFDDPFGKPEPAFASPAQRYRGTPERDVGVARSNSLTSTGEKRPLPPLPAGMSNEIIQGPHPTLTGNLLDPRVNKSSGTVYTDEQSYPDRATSASSTSALPQARTGMVTSQPRPASMSKADLLGMRSSPMPLEERLQLLSVQNEEAARKAKSADRKSVESTMTPDIAAQDEEDPVQEYKPPPRVSRESILRKVKSRTFNENENEASSPIFRPSSTEDNIDYANLDPDVPIPSRETSSTYEDELGVHVKREDEPESTIDRYAAMDDHDEVLRSVSPFDDYLRESSVIHHAMPEDDVSELSNEDTVMVRQETASQEVGSEPDSDERSVEHNIPTVESDPAQVLDIDNSRMSLPEFSSFFNKEDDFGFGLGSYLTPSPPQEINTVEPSTPSSSAHLIERKPVLRPATPPEQIVLPLSRHESSAYELGTPDSVIHHAAEEVEPAQDTLVSGIPAMEAPEVPAPQATIKAPGSKLKTRVSATPADIQQMASSRRLVSTEMPASALESESGSRPSSRDTDYSRGAVFNRRQSIKRLDVPVGNELSLGLSEEFDRLLEAKKKGYVTRESDRVIIANSRHASGESKASDNSNPEHSAPAIDLRPDSSRGSRSAGNSPRKGSAQTWTTEPWNGRMRRQSTRRTNIVSEKRTSLGPAPPLPGQESNVAGALDTVTEDQPIDDGDESGERGRLFVKVVGVKDLDLPLPKNERSFFQMTLDNGLHCVTTSWSELGRTAPIGQEFELVVFDDLEFQLLLQTRLERPKSAASSVQSCASSTTAKKASALSRLFTSPKKRREEEKRRQEEEARLAEERRKEFEAQRASKLPTAWDLQNELVGADGSFARAYVALSGHEQQCYGRPFTVDIPAWNEWAIEGSGASVRSKMGGIQHRPPYKIGNIELQLMYIPRPRLAEDEDMPKSMSAAIRSLKEAEATVTRNFEGHLSQQGGDCPYWRRRFFKLNGSKLTAYHDMTRQPRATISLAKATKLIDDKSSLTKTDQPASPVKGKGRRKSAFAEDEEGYMFIEDGFRIKFANGEVIDFYADNGKDKEEWMKVLGEGIGRDSPSEKKTWMSIVLARERAVMPSQPPPAKLNQIQQDRLQPRNTSRSAPTSPRKELNAGPFTSAGLKEARPPPVEKSPRHEMTAPSPSKAKHRSSASTSAVASPNKPQPRPRSPLKPDSSPSKRNSAVNTGSTSSATSAGSPRKAITGKRAAVRSMIF